MRPSRGMGAMNPKKIRKIRKRDGDEPVYLMAKGGLYENIHAKRKRIAAGSGERMRKPGTSGAPTASAFKKAALSTKGKRK
jgi:hypothetical protein